MGVEERERRKRSVRDAVVVDDHRVDAGCADGLESLVIARPAVARHEKRRARAQDAREGGTRQPVAALETVREQRNDVRAEGSQHVGDQGRGGDPVRVVVAEDADALPDAHRPGQASDRLAAVLHRVGRREVREARVEETGRLSHIEHSPRNEHRRSRSSYPQSAR